MGITYIEGMVQGPTGKEAPVRLLVDSGATYTLLPYEVWQAIELTPSGRPSFPWRMVPRWNGRSPRVPSVCLRVKAIHRSSWISPGMKP